MTDTIKSALFVDFDSLHRSLRNLRREAAGRLAERAAAWVAAIEAGRLVSPSLPDDGRRRILVRRCYADPTAIGADRAAFVASGFEIVDCPPRTGRDGSAAPIHMALDAIDALGHPTGYEEFILLSADADFSPLLVRLRANDRTAVIYAGGAASAAYRSQADGVIEEAALAVFLASSSLAAAEAAAEAAAAQAAVAGTADRNEIESLARKVHAATNVPLFSPKTFADLFRMLAQEIAEQGYHFQNTAENVATKLIAAGRNVNRRQVLFVVKGLGLKGHVFSTSDAPEHLAEVFREQVLYLVNNASLELDPRELALISSWIVGRVPTSQGASDGAKAQVDEPRLGKKRIAKPVIAREPASAPAEEQRPAEPAPAALPPARAPALASEKTAAPAKEAPRAAPSGVGGPTPERVAEPDRAGAAARLAALAKGTPGGAKPSIFTPSRPAPVGKPGPVAKPAPAAKGGPQKPAPARPNTPRPAAEPNKEALESSILAAIAQAVDVLVEDSAAKKQPDSRPKPEAPPAADVATPEPTPSEGGDSGDIGDEIQRIIASYSRARQQGDKT